MTEMPSQAEQLTRHQYRKTFSRCSDRAMQEHAEREGHVPPGIGPVSVSWYGESSRTVIWEWIKGEDSTGQTKEMWFADGPWAGQRPRKIEADLPNGTVVAFPNLAETEDADDDGNLNPMDIRYRLEQREDGLWFGRWVR